MVEEEIHGLRKAREEMPPYSPPPYEKKYASEE